MVMGTIGPLSRHLIQQRWPRTGARVQPTRPPRQPTTRERRAPPRATRRGDSIDDLSPRRFRRVLNFLAKCSDGAAQQGGAGNHVPRVSRMKLSHADDDLIVWICLTARD